MLERQFEPDDLGLALAAGEESAFRDLLDSIGPRLHRAAARMLGSCDDADDAVQEVFVSLVRSRKRLCDVENLSAYVFVVLYRIVGRLLKSRQKQPMLLNDLDDQTALERRSADVDEELLNRLVQSLPIEQREVVVLRTDGGLTFVEIGELLGVNANTVASRFRYALEKLRAQLTKEPC